ncbi:heparinase II/III family protein [Flavivirga eckloniae]|uniref:Heparinase n=1 Tax=Flavivirga eckloniae TaxID=1803846 RepID=A0A2K9PPD6_9FLAO|nr:heparinase II/III family protein [Flavivirga eckloniae]AUP78688.1 heparinase [Flavivirga eckloniae]
MEAIKRLPVLVFFWSVCLCAQDIPSKEIISTGNLGNFLKDEVKEIISDDASVSEADLAHYLRDAFSKRYFYDWKHFDERFKNYTSIYKGIENSHTERALDHLSKFSGETTWKLPFNYLNGTPVNAYALRHLARQHKMVDIAFYYNYQNKNAKHLNYFKDQLKSLNTALSQNKYEKIEDGNGVYEAFRSGYRILNWLQIHNMFLGEAAYSNKDQLMTIATLLQHGAHLYERNQKFRAGNHQTRGLSALAMLSILLRDFKGTEQWYKHAMHLLEEHLVKEINDDGFQFERTVHYHISDIGNYFYVYQLAKTSKLEVNTVWENRLRSLFTTLTKIAYPDKSAPVFSDDTDNPWADKNDISGALTLGYLLFKDPTMGYFAEDRVEAKMYWYLSDAQLKSLKAIKKQQPDYGSLEFPTTGYYVMRQGWGAKDNMMVISAGLDAHKPDHQHGDMLGVQAMANGRVILPNYQVRYSLKDLELFKNSMVKNVALVDDELQGKQYTSNKGGSGFGKFKVLPQPKTIAWKTNKNLDLFVGSHNGFENVGVQYNRQAIYIKDDFWIVKDNFKSNKPHTYKQIWQGHYSLEASPDLIRATFEKAEGLDIYQLVEADTVFNSGQRGKGWSVVSKKDRTNYSFITVLFPYKGYANRINETQTTPNFKNWKLNQSKWKAEGEQVISLTKEEMSLFFSAKQLRLNKVQMEFSELSDVFIKQNSNKLVVQSLSEKELLISIKGVTKAGSIKLLPGNQVDFIIKD